jgi:redox-regulated HSP33 family molecular chaperone
MRRLTSSLVMEKSAAIEAREYLGISTKDDCVRLLQPFNHITLEWIAQKFPKQADKKSDGRQAVSNGKIRSFRVQEFEDGKLKVACYVVSKICKKYYWCEAVLDPNEEEFEYRCSCSAKYVEQILFY